MAAQIANITELEGGFDAMGFSQGPSINLSLNIPIFWLTIAISQEDNSYAHMSNATIPPRFTTSLRLARSTSA